MTSQRLKKKKKKKKEEEDDENKQPVNRGSPRSPQKWLYGHILRRRSLVTTAAALRVKTGYMHGYIMKR